MAVKGENEHVMDTGTVNLMTFRLLSNRKLRTPLFTKWDDQVKCVCVWDREREREKEREREVRGETEREVVVKENENKKPYCWLHNLF
jgi:hypothetical protein